MFLLQRSDGSHGTGAGECVHRVEVIALGSGRSRLRKEPLIVREAARHSLLGSSLVRNRLPAKVSRAAYLPRRLCATKETCRTESCLYSQAEV